MKREESIRMQIAHICKKYNWERALKEGSYNSFSLTEEGFIHCCSPEQIYDVADRFFKGENDLIVLWIDTIKVQSEIRFEEADDDIFPHVYGPINLDTIDRVSDLKFDGNNFSLD